MMQLLLWIPLLVLINLLLYCSVLILKWGKLLIHPNDVWCLRGPSLFHRSFMVLLLFYCSYGVEELLNTLSRLHDSLLPSLLQGFKVMSKSQSNGEASPDSMLSDTALSIRMLSKRTVRFGWRLLHYCYLNDQLKEHDAQTSTKMFPANVEDPMIRGDILVQTLKDINREATYSSQLNHGNTFLQSIESEFQLMSRIDDIRNKGTQSSYFTRLTIVMFSSSKKKLL